MWRHMSRSARALPKKTAIAVGAAVLLLLAATAMAAVKGGTYRGHTSQPRSTTPEHSAMFIKVNKGRIIEVNFGFDSGGALCEEGDFDTGKGFSSPVGHKGRFGFKRYGFTVSGQFHPGGTVTGSFRQTPFHRNRRACGTGRVTYSLTHAK